MPIELIGEDERAKSLGSEFMLATAGKHIQVACFPRHMLDASFFISPRNMCAAHYLHDTLYLSDGNIVLIAPHSGEHNIAFCVHRSVLSKISSVFESMLTLPRGDSDRSPDGHPVVQMLDRAEELTRLLQVLYAESWVCATLSRTYIMTPFSRELPSRRLDPATPSNVRHILNLANKYAIDHLRRRIVSQLEGDWPQSLTQWDRLNSKVAQSDFTNLEGGVIAGVTPGIVCFWAGGSSIHWVGSLIASE